MDDEQWEATEWTQQDVNLLHKMVRDYDRAQWLKKRLWWWIAWLLGLPALALTVSEPIVRLWKLFKGG